MLKSAVPEIREAINGVRLLSWRAPLMKNEDLKMGGISLFLLISPILIVSEKYISSLWMLPVRGTESTSQEQSLAFSF